jgi:hypothetical protein
MKMGLPLTVLVLCSCVTIFSDPVSAQSAAGAGTSSGQQQTTPTAQEQPSHRGILSHRAAAVQPGQPYQRPTEKDKLHGFIFDAFGPYAFISAVTVAGIQQARNRPPDWGQGWGAYGDRVASDFGINLVTQTTRYGLAELFREDTLYYRCECKGFFPRLNHALISTLTSRRGEDGHRVFSFPDLVAPYAGTMVGVYAWYPDRFGAKDAFRLGNYSLIGYAAENVGLEFLYQGPHKWLTRMHLNNTRAAPTPDQSQ